MTASGDLRLYARRLDVAEKRVCRQVGKEVTKIAIATARPATGGDAILGHGGKGRPIRLRGKTRIYAAANETTVIVWGLPAGAWRWITDGTEPHAIRRRRRGRLARMTVDHPGMSGSGVWDRAELIAYREVPRLFYVAVRHAIEG